MRRETFAGCAVQSGRGGVDAGVRAGDLCVGGRGGTPRDGPPTHTSKKTPQLCPISAPSRQPFGTTRPPNSAPFATATSARNGRSSASALAGDSRIPEVDKLEPGCAGGTRRVGPSSADESLHPPDGDSRTWPQRSQRLRQVSYSLVHSRSTLPVMDTISDPLAGYDDLLRRHGGRHGGRPVDVLHPSGAIRYRDPVDVPRLARLPWFSLLRTGLSTAAPPSLWSASYRGSVRLALARDHAIRRLLALDVETASRRGLPQG